MKDRQAHLRSDEGELGDISPKVFREELHRLADWIADYRENISEQRIAPNDEPGAILAQLDAAAPETAAPLDEIFADVERVIVPGVTHWAHPQFMSYFGCTTTSPGILAEMITGALNVNAMTWRTAPAATELETLVLDWLRQWLHLPNDFTGVVYDTASISTMHALATAREQAAPNTRKLGLSGRDLPTFRIYTSDQAHSSVEKGAIAIGIGEDNVQRVRTDAEFRIDVSALRETIASDLRKNLKPLAVVATVGTTSTASVDPIPEIVQICREHKIWLHIDGAYGAGLALLPECKWVTAGWNEADSIVINPHKMLFVPLDFSALYLRDIGRLRRLFTLVPEYLHLRDPVGAEINYMDYGVQLGRRFRALKAWVVWRAFGREGLAARIRDHLRLAKLFTSWLRDDVRFELWAPVVMGVVCFRFKVGDDESKIDIINSKIVEGINASGRAYLTQTKLHGRTVMRIGLGNVLTTEEHLRNVWKMIQRTADEVDRAVGAQN
ncbi:MAG TPA: aminotransferase class I/II-fold pyridoxal phosphate-dependent enzyme [Candidatus Binatus sp.]|nr:aminotransferase class I/II-fold pyridoxal phosphate-dependent enzyme [Candidatus Binatus sp.]